jgi:hypothetical protein
LEVFGFEGVAEVGGFVVFGPGEREGEGGEEVVDYWSGIRWGF